MKSGIIFNHKNVENLWKNNMSFYFTVDECAICMLWECYEELCKKYLETLYLYKHMSTKHLNGIYYCG